MIKVIGRREIAEILIMFLIVQCVGLYLAVTASHTLSIASLKVEISSPQALLFSYILDGMLIATVLLLVLNRMVPNKHHHHFRALEDNVFYAVLEAAVVIATSFFFFLVIYDVLFPYLAWPTTFIMAIGTSVLLIATKDITHHIRNAVTMSSSIGVGLLLGLYFSFGYAFIALAIVAIYDFVAVFVTKSMIKIAKAVSSRDLALIISTAHVESVPKGSYSELAIKDYEGYLHRTHEDENPAYKRILGQGRLPVMSQIQLGEGDLGLPLMASVSAYYTFSVLLVPELITIGAAIGLLSAIWILKSYKKPLPAVPPLFAFMSIAAGIALILTNNASGYSSVLLLGTGVAVIAFVAVLRVVERSEKSEAAEGPKT